MAKNSKKTIPLGSGDLYGTTVPNSLPGTDAEWVALISTVCVDANMLGKVKSGASIEYSGTMHTEKCDDNSVVKIVTVDEDASLKPGLIAWNSEILYKVIDRSKVTIYSSGAGTTAKNYRICKLGGKGNEKDQDFVLIFHHIDKSDGDTWTILVGRNTAPITFKYAPDAGSMLEPTFTATPLDTDGTLIVFIEELDDGESRPGN